MKYYQVDETHLGTNFPSLSSIPDPLCTLPFHKITLALSWLTDHFLKVLADDFSEAYGVTCVGAGRMKGRYGYLYSTLFHLLKIKQTTGMSSVLILKNYLLCRYY